MARKEKRYHFIYKTTNLLNGRYYYGMHSTDNLNDGYQGSGRRLKYSLNKHGKENHKVEIIEFLPDRKSLIEREKEIVNLNEIAKEDCMNIVLGGTGGFISLDGCKRGGINSIKQFRNKYNSDKSFKNEINEKLRLAIEKRKKTGTIKTWKDNYNWLGKYHKKESKEKIGKTNSIKQKGILNSQHGTHWITNGYENKKIKNNVSVPIGWKFGRINSMPQMP